jgi:hypothetical protein
LSEKRFHVVHQRFHVLDDEALHFPELGCVRGLEVGAHELDEDVELVRNPCGLPFVALDRVRDFPHHLHDAGEGSQDRVHLVS